MERNDVFCEASFCIVPMVQKPDFESTRSRVLNARPQRLLRTAAAVALPAPHACLTCPDFLTTVEHLPAHRDQLASTIQLIDMARAAGRERLVEQNEQIRLNLSRIIEGLETLPQHEDEHAC